MKVHSESQFHRLLKVFFDTDARPFVYTGQLELFAKAEHIPVQQNQAPGL